MSLLLACGPRFDGPLVFPILAAYGLVVLGFWAVVTYLTVRFVAFVIDQSV